MLYRQNGPALGKISMRGGTTNPQTWLGADMNDEQSAEGTEPETVEEETATGAEKSNEQDAEKTPDGDSPKAKKPGPKPKPDGFRAECYKKIEKGIDRNTVMVVMKGRHRIGDGSNVFVGENFKAHEMDARLIMEAMNRYWIVPEADVPEKDERKKEWTARMMAKYEPGKEPSKCR